MRTFLQLVLSGTLLISTMQSAGYAAQKLKEYRIEVANIADVTIGQLEPEDPFPLEIALKNKSELLVIKTDGHAESCLKTIENALEKTTGIIKISVDEEAQTLNGVIITQCVWVSK